MPVPAAIASAAQEYRFNNDFLVKSVKDLSPEEWLQRASPCTNHIAWVVGHVIWTRKALLGRLGTEWSAPWLGMFARGAKVEDGAAYPSPDALLDAWREVSTVLAGAFENASEEMLAQPAKNGPPSSDGKESGIVNFLAWHETYHVGQISLLRCLLGHKGLMG
ncbi:MAG TPA: DinB family protein [Terracidiphilus sp.]|jgi:uncharacterized damage-inducible protein DinB|nr:DinB family protein [Terracidiphilus sp.]